MVFANKKIKSFFGYFFLRGSSLLLLTIGLFLLSNRFHNVYGSHQSPELGGVFALVISLTTFIYSSVNCIRIDLKSHEMDIEKYFFPFIRKKTFTMKYSEISSLKISDYFYRLEIVFKNSIKITLPKEIVSDPIDSGRKNRAIADELYSFLKGKTKKSEI